MESDLKMVSSKEKKRFPKKERKAAEKPKRKLSRLRPSVMLDAFTRWFCMLLSVSFGAKFLSAYTAEESALKRLLYKRKKQKNIHYKNQTGTRNAASIAEKIMLTKPLKRLRYVMLKCPFSYYTDTILLYAICSLLANFLVLFFSSVQSLTVGVQLSSYFMPALVRFMDINESPIAWVNAALILLFALFPLPIRSRSLHDVKMGSRILSAFFERILGAKGELTEELQNRNSDLENGVRRAPALRMILLLLAIGAGVLSAFVSPFYIFLIPAGLFLISTVIRTPEAGLILSVCFLPILSFFGSYNHLYTLSSYGTTFSDMMRAIGAPTLILVSLVLLTTISYLIKVLRKKRLFRFGLLDASILLIGVAVIFYGIYPHTTRTSMTEALITVIFLLLYFLSVNLLRSEAWIERVLKALLAVSFAMLTVGIYVYFFGIPNLGWLPIENIKGSAGNIALLFGGEAFLGAFLVLIFPLALSSLVSSKSTWRRIFGAMCVPEILFVAFHLSSKIPLTFCFVEIFFFALLCTYKTLYAMPIVATAAGLVYRLTPNGKSLYTFLSEVFIENFAHKIYIWDLYFSVGPSIPLLGTGYGLIRFSEYAPATSEYASSGFWMQTLWGMGIPGVIIFSLFALFFLQMCFEELKLAQGSHLCFSVAGGMVAVLSFFLYGFFMPIFVDVRLIFLFWLIAGVTGAFRMVSLEKRNNHALLRQQPMSDRNADMIVY